MPVPRDKRQKSFHSEPLGIITKMNVCCKFQANLVYNLGDVSQSILRTKSNILIGLLKFRKITSEVKEIGHFKIKKMQIIFQNRFFNQGEDTIISFHTINQIVQIYTAFYKIYGPKPPSIGIWSKPFLVGVLPPRTIYAKFQVSCLAVSALLCQMSETGQSLLYSIQIIIFYHFLIIIFVFYTVYFNIF